MERALYVTRLNEINAETEHYDRLYFGAEFCQFRIPSPALLRQAREAAAQHGWSFSLMTPYVTDEGLAALADLLPELRDGDEVIVNDWGVLDWVATEHERLTVVLGRLLTKQKRGPRILNVLDVTPPDMLSHYRRSNVDVPHLRDFLTGQMRVERFELDNPLQGMERRPAVPASLYTPWMYVSTTRLCLVNHCENRTQSLRAIFQTDFACQKHQFTLEHDNMPATLHLVGNTIFVENDGVPENLEQLGIDRLVFQPRPPM
ncbi:MAG: hypothetical protein P9L99_18290 [Candidatus Lernaella stagnicola]|nr:hypothetical protein [Candidatus Lernaella stagnicola]